jgi:ribosomal protein L32E
MLDRHLTCSLQMKYRHQRRTYFKQIKLGWMNKIRTHAPSGLARLTLNDVRSIEHNAQAVEEQSRVFPGDPRVHFREVPW